MGSRSKTARVVVSGAAHELAADDRDLIDALRAAGIRGVPPRGCSDGSCGSCRVLVDSAIERACRLRASRLDDGMVILLGCDVEHEPLPSLALAAFRHERPTRCELCVDAVAVTAAFLARRPDDARAKLLPTVLEDASCGCTGIGSWRRALRRALRTSGDADD